MQENITIKKFVYDNDEEPVSELIVVKNTRSKGKKSRSSWGAFTVAIIQTYNYLLPFALIFALYLLSIPTKHYMNETSNIPSRYVCGSWKIYKCLFTTLLTLVLGIWYRRWLGLQGRPELQQCSHAEAGKQPKQFPQRYLPPSLGKYQYPMKMCYGGWRLTRVKSFIDLVSRIDVSPVPYNWELGLDHAYKRLLKDTQGFYWEFPCLPGWISVTRMGVFTSSLMREPVKAFTACLVAV